MFKVVQRYNNRRPDGNALVPVLCNTALSQRHRATFMFRYVMELCENMHLDCTTNRRKIAKAFYTFGGFHKVKNLVLSHYTTHPPRLGTVHRCRMGLWVSLIACGLDSIVERCKLVGLHSCPRLLTLDECVQIDVPLPPPLQNTKMVRAVNAFAERVLHTRNTDSVCSQTSLSLRSVVGVHVCGSRERSATPHTNGSLAMSTTDNPRCAIQYALFYSQVLPCSLWVDVDPDYTASTPDVLRKCGAENWHTAVNISTHHNEYIPKTVSYIPAVAVKQITPLWFEGMRIHTADCIDKAFEEPWMRVNEGHFMSLALASQLRRALTHRRRQRRCSIGLNYNLRRTRKQNTSQQRAAM